MRQPADSPIVVRGVPHAALAPTILLTATLHWPMASRLATAFAELGCRVEVLCPRGHPAWLTQAASRIHRHAATRPLQSLQNALVAAAPDLVIPCDDDAAIQLHRLHGASATGPLATLIERSLGSPPACALATARAELLAVAVAAGVLAPTTMPLADDAALQAWLATHRLPMVLKIDGTWGGRGVAVVRSDDEARRLFARMSARPRLWQALLRTLLDRDPSLLAAALRTRPPAVTAQDFIDGRPANRAVACWQGEVLAGTSVEALQTQHPTGPATVVRLIDNDRMSQAAERIVRRLGLSGLWGFDFVIEAATGEAHLIEMNPRATPICHLALGNGHDLPAALHAQLSGSAVRRSAAAIDNPVVALFPGEWQRDPASPHLRTAHHDVPWTEPALVRDGVARPWAERGLVARAWRRLRRARAAPPEEAAAGPSPMALDRAR